MSYEDLLMRHNIIVKVCVLREFFCSISHQDKSDIIWCRQILEEGNISFRKLENRNWSKQKENVGQINKARSFLNHISQRSYCAKITCTSFLLFLKFMFSVMHSCSPIIHKSIWFGQWIVIIFQHVVFQLAFGIVGISCGRLEFLIENLLNVLSNETCQ